MTLFESWKHYPVERRRLLWLLREFKQNVLFLSGDVHFAEVNHVDRFIEVTSSGVTHDVIQELEGDDKEFD